jgi:DNA-repair protein XRCC4
MSNNYFCEVLVKLNDKQNNYYLLSQSIDEKKYELLFTSTHNSFKGVLDLEECKRNDSEWDEHNNQFKTIEALRLGSKRINSDSINGYEYEFDITTIDENHDNYSSQLLLNVYESQELIVKTPILSFNVTKSDSFSVMSEVMPKILKLIESKDKIIERLDSENKNLREISDKAVESLDYFTVKKKENDSILYSKFVAVLNEKKNKIRELEEELNRK